MRGEAGFVGTETAGGMVNRQLRPKCLMNVGQRMLVLVVSVSPRIT